MLDEGRPPLIRPLDPNALGARGLRQRGEQLAFELFPDVADTTGRHRHPGHTIRLAVKDDDLDLQSGLNEQHANHSTFPSTRFSASTKSVERFACDAAGPLHTCPPQGSGKQAATVLVMNFANLLKASVNHGAGGCGRAGWQPPHFADRFPLANASL
jgi:hypothetical protein